MAQAPNGTPRKRGFFARLFSGRADMGDKYNVRVTFTRLFDEKNRACMQWLWDASEGFRGRILALMIASCIITFVGVAIEFLLTALVLFAIVKVVNKFKKKEEPKPAEKPRLCPYCKGEIAKDATRCPHCTSVFDPVTK